MNEQMRLAMLEATRLTRAGQLMEATALIQRALRGERVEDSVSSANAPSDDTIIEGTFRVVTPNEPATQQTTKPIVIPQLPDSTKKPEPRQPAPSPSRVARVKAAKSEFLTQSYSNQAGARNYKLFIPSGYHGQALPLVVMLHGCTQTPDDFASGTRMNLLAEEQSCFIAYPAQASAANQSRCWNWFKASNQVRDHGEPSLIAGITREIMRRYTIDSQRVFVAGLSAGGAMAVIMGQLYPELYAAVAVHSGLASGIAHDVPSALAAMQRGRSNSAAMRQFVPTIAFHGDQDNTVHQRNSETVIAELATLHAEQAGKLRLKIQRGQVPAGRSYTQASYYNPQGKLRLEQWVIHGAGHAWSGGSATGSFTDPNGPDATQHIMRFFLSANA